MVCCPRGTGLLFAVCSSFGAKQVRRVGNTSCLSFRRGFGVYSQIQRAQPAPTPGLSILSLVPPWCSNAGGMEPGGEAAEAGPAEWHFVA